MNKIKEAQKKAEEFKNSLASMSFEGESLNGMVKAVCNGNKEFSAINVNESIYKIREQAEVEQMIVEAVNEAISKADIEARTQMSSILPNIPGLNL
ncbi:MAG: YbaB/EbfC family nucleoid-associated protein [Bacteroidia bacterium]